MDDIRYGLRLLRWSPGFAATTILTLALGIGATTAIFSTVDALLIRALLCADADRVVMISARRIQISDFRFQIFTSDF
jgi:hypothetical protein